MDDYVDILLDYGGYLIGSRRWGGYDENSDYDIVINESILKIFKENLPNYDLMKLLEITYNDNRFKTLKNYEMVFTDKILNIMVYRDDIDYLIIYKKITEVFNQYKKPISKPDRFDIMSNTFSQVYKTLYKE